MTKTDIFLFVLFALLVYFVPRWLHWLGNLNESNDDLHTKDPPGTPRYARPALKAPAPKPPDLTSLGPIVSFPSQILPHRFTGRSDRDCARCGLPDRDPVHAPFMTTHTSTSPLNSEDGSYKMRRTE